MTTLREAAQQALEALGDPWKAGPEGVADAITALKAALEQPEQEKYKLCSHGYYQDSEGNMQAGEIPDEMLSLTATRLSQVVQAVGPSEQPEQEQQAEVQALMKMQSELQRERDYWEEEARRYAGNADFWKNKHEQPEQEPCDITEDGVCEALECCKERRDA